MLASSFMFGYMFASPVFGFMALRIRLVMLMIGGLIAWTISVIASGFSPNFLTLLLVRCGVGMATVIAIGYAVGGPMAQYSNWRILFFGEAGLMVLLLVLVFCQRASFDSKKSERGRRVPIRVRATLLAFLKNPAWILSTAGNAVLYFLFGAFSFWGPSYLNQELGLDLSLANYTFGGMVVVMGLLGTFVGGLLCDKIAHSGPYSAIRTAFCLSCISGLLGVTFLIFAFLAQATWLFFVLGCCGVFFLFWPYSPICATWLSSVPIHLRSLSTAVALLFSHLCGDFPSPTALAADAVLTVMGAPPRGGLWGVGMQVLGALSDWMHSKRYSFIICTGAAYLMPAVWLAGWILKPRSPKEPPTPEDEPVANVDLLDPSAVTEEDLSLERSYPQRVPAPAQQDPSPPPGGLSSYDPRALARSISPGREGRVELAEDGEGAPTETTPFLARSPQDEPAGPKGPPAPGKTPHVVGPTLVIRRAEL
ncbi:sphingolipid transporter [Paratrimastix pyriformis]|uniref:Sphingolipid transporter n=1 Tax=Paratrimastix pyriformis TaxID=342808 RepID=A0ABQ8UJC6_9EUKA|nr:sphingolipid transporter [Paratrimastix pyriformis]